MHCSTGPRIGPSTRPTSAPALPVLTDFIEPSSSRYGFTRAPTGIGVSNSAVMAVVLFLIRPGLLAGAILFPLSPFGHDSAEPSGWHADANHQRRQGQPSGDSLRLAERLSRVGTRSRQPRVPR